MKNIIIAGPARAGKSTLARKIKTELGHFVINIDKLAAAFGGAFPQLDIRLAWNRDKTTDNIAPFLGHFLGLFSSPGGHALDPTWRSLGAVPGNHFVLEGAYVNFDKIAPILKTYGIEEISEHFTCIGLVQNNKSPEDFVRDFKQHDTTDDWTYGFSDTDLHKVAEDLTAFSRKMTEHLAKHNFTIYDTSVEREQVLRKIARKIKETTQ